MTLRTENLTVCYGTNKVLDGVSFALLAGKTTTLLGPDGCRKSTLLDCFSRLLTPQSGGVFLGDSAINMLSSRQLARRLALLPQHHLAPEGITVQEPVSYGRNPQLSFWGCLSVENNTRVHGAMNQTRIQYLAERRLTDLSGGQRQRAFLATVLAQDTSVVLLDEPTTYLDISHQVELMRLMGELRAQGKTVVAALHDLNQASRYCDHLVVMANGHVTTQGTPEVVMNPGLLRAVFSMDTEIHPEPVSGRLMCIVRQMIQSVTVPWLQQVAGYITRATMTSVHPGNISTVLGRIMLRRSVINHHTFRTSQNHINHRFIDRRQRRSRIILSTIATREM